MFVPVWCQKTVKTRMTSVATTARAGGLAVPAAIAASGQPDERWYHQVADATCVDVEKKK